MPKPKPKRIRAESRKGTILLLVAVPKPMHRQLVKIKLQTGATMNELVRRAVEFWIQATKAKP